MYLAHSAVKAGEYESTDGRDLLYCGTLVEAKMEQLYQYYHSPFSQDSRPSSEGRTSPGSLRETTWCVRKLTRQYKYQPSGVMGGGGGRVTPLCKLFR